MKFECLRAFTRLVRNLKSITFGETWPELFDYTWKLVQTAQAYVSSLEQNPHEVAVEEQDESSVIVMEEIKVEVASNSQQPNNLQNAVSDKESDRQFY